MKPHGRVLTTAPEVEPLTLDEAKEHLREDGMGQDALISALIVAARQWVETRAWRALITQEWDMYYRRPTGACALVVPMPPTQSVDAVTYIDAAGDSKVMDPADYVVDTASQPARIYPVTAWPAMSDVSGAVVVAVTAGFGDDPEDVPQHYRQAMLLVLGHWYANRESVVVGTIAAHVPEAAQALLDLDHARSLMGFAG
jgi:uncharacterized phiE125 gp8 family phage protein